jgi:hypothetical protein
MEKCIKLFLETHFFILFVSTYKPKYSCTIMYTCEKSSQPNELSYIDFIKFSHLSLFHVNVICKK